MTIKFFKVLALLSAAVLASCQSFDTSSRGPIEAPKPVGIDGDWVDTRGVNNATFAGGVFTSVFQDTGKVAARGSYTFRDAQNIDLAFTSLLRNTSVNASCLLIMQNQMNCTTSSGAKFSLVRKGSSPTIAAPAAATMSPNPAGVPADAVLISKS